MVNVLKSLVARKGALKNVDLLTLAATFALVILGFLAVFTATIDPQNPQRGLLQAPSALVNRQMVFAVFAAMALVVAAIVDYRLLKIYAVFAYIAVIVLLLVVLTPLIGEARGIQAWISFGSFKLQPSELAKPVLVLMLASYISSRRGNMDSRDVIRCILLTALPSFLVFLQPDFGTMLILVAILGVMLVLGGTSWRQLAAIAVVGVIGVSSLFALGLMRDYQASRLTAFLDPESDPNSTGYNYRLTRQAVGNGGLLGTGILPKDELSLTTNLAFVPERHTDFVFTVIAEQLGFVGACLLLSLYSTIFLRSLKTARQARESFGSLIVAGLVGYLIFQVFINIGMTVGLVPITGVPLPFVSYGGSSLLASAVSIGIVMSVHARRFALA